METDNANPPRRTYTRRKRAARAPRAARLNSTRKSTRYPGLRDNILKLFEKANDPAKDVSERSLKMAEVKAAFPEVPVHTISYHVYALRSHKEIVSTKQGFKLRDPGDRTPRKQRDDSAPSPNSGPPAVVEPARARQGRVRLLPAERTALNSFAERQVESIILRMQNANEAGQLFTQIDFDCMRRLVNGVAA